MTLQEIILSDLALAVALGCIGYAAAECMARVDQWRGRKRR